VTRLRWILIFVLFGATVWVSAIPQVDLPETTFNEADAPVNLAPPVWPRIQVPAPALELSSVLPAFRPVCVTCMASSPAPMKVPLSALGHRHSLNNLLCTLLI
jgi:hypothetical protein